MSQQDTVARIKEQHTAEIFAKPNVVGVGTGYKVSKGQRTDDLSVIVLVQQKVPKAALSADALTPSELNGVPTDVVEVGLLRAHQARTDRWRPAPGGVSLGHYLVTAGTFGAVVRDRASGARLILSNNHVLANTNNAQTGDPILQPGAVDGGQQPDDVIARLERFCPIDFGSDVGTCPIAGSVAGLANVLAGLLGSAHRLETYQTNPEAVNQLDAAVARPLSDDLIQDEIIDIGVMTGTVAPGLLMSVRKSGRSTGFTTGEITVLNATVDVSYGTGRTARFDNQIVTSPMSAPGDSGSLLVAADSLNAVGLLFAGSEQSTIHTPIQVVLDCLEVTF